MPKESELFLVDSSGWIEFLGNGPLADRFAPYMQFVEQVIVPVIVLYEVYKKLLLIDGTVANGFLSVALRGRVVPIDDRLALHAAKISIDRRLAMADAIIYTTALGTGAHLVTSDAHFQGLPQVTVYRA